MLCYSLVFLFQSHDGTSLEHLDKTPTIVVVSSDQNCFNAQQDISRSAKGTLVMKNGSVQLLDTSLGKLLIRVF